MIVRQIAMFVIGGIGATFVGFGIVCFSEGNVFGGRDFTFWGVLALITALVLWKKPAWLLGERSS